MFFGFDDGLCLVALAMSFKESVKTFLQGLIVIFKPAMRRQAKIGLGTVAMPLENSDLCRSDIDLWVLSLPVGLELQRSRNAEPGDLGNDELSSRLISRLRSPCYRSPHLTR